MHKNKKIVLILTLILLINIICIDFVSAEAYNNYSSSLVSCGTIKNIPSSVPKIISIAYVIIQVAVPILLVIFGSLDLVKSIMGGKEDEIKKGQQVFVKRIVAAALVFFVFVIVKLVVSLVTDDKEQNKGIMDCVECFISNKCDQQTVGQTGEQTGGQT